MPRLRLIPSLLLKGGRLVKGVAYRDWKDAGHPVATARAHNAQGADEILLVDTEASVLGRPPDMATLAAVAAVSFIPLTVGGGIRDIETARQCIAGGADKVMVTTGPLDRPELIDALARDLGQQAIVIGIDTTEDESGSRHLYDHRSSVAIADRGWLEWMKEAVDRGAGEVRLMAAGREGRRNGLDLMLHAEASAAVSVPVILEGGAGSLADLDRGFSSGVDAIALGTMLVFSDNNIVKLKQYLINRGHPVRRITGG